MNSTQYTTIAETFSRLAGMLNGSVPSGAELTYGTVRNFLDSASCEIDSGNRDAYWPLIDGLEKHCQVAAEGFEKIGFFDSLELSHLRHGLAAYNRSSEDSKELTRQALHAIAREYETSEEPRYSDAA